MYTYIFKTETNEDLLEINPEYARNAPPKPVIHRRSSVDWENFESEQNNVKTQMCDNYTTTNNYDQFISSNISNKQTKTKG